MAAIDQYIERIADENLRGEIQMELARLMKKKSKKKYGCNRSIHRTHS